MNNDCHFFVRFTDLTIPHEKTLCQHSLRQHDVQKTVHAQSKPHTVVRTYKKTHTLVSGGKNTNFTLLKTFVPQ